MANAELRSTGTTANQLTAFRFDSQSADTIACQAQLWAKDEMVRTNHVELPHFVLVGDQSAGKSSVLNTISGIKFPTGPDGCTRFAVEFHLRHAEESLFSIRIIPSVPRTEADRNRLARFNYIPRSEAQFSDLMQKAEEAIFINAKRRFVSRDILKVEIAGPTMPHLTIVDLPGFFHTPTFRYTPEDMQAINEIALDYMSNPRTIILAIVSGSSDYASQIVLKKALDCDKGGTRTLGIVTKPEFARVVGLEDKFLSLVKNDDINLDLGWHVLRNRAPEEKDLTVNDHNRVEQEFFAHSRWSTLPTLTTGVHSLIAKLDALMRAKE